MSWKPASSVVDDAPKCPSSDNKETWRHPRAGHPDDDPGPPEESLRRLTFHVTGDEVEVYVQRGQASAHVAGLRATFDDSGLPAELQAAVAEARRQVGDQLAAARKRVDDSEEANALAARRVAVSAAETKAAALEEEARKLR